MIFSQKKKKPTSFTQKTLEEIFIFIFIFIIIIFL